MGREVVIDRGVIEFLLSNKNIGNDFPSLRSFKTVKPHERSCCGRSKGRQIDFQRAKRALMGLPKDQQDKLKKFLKADKIIFHIPGRSGIETRSF